MKDTLFWISAAGGEPTSITEIDQGVSALGISPDGKTMAVLRKADDGVYSLYTSSPIGAPYRRYTPAPFSTKGVFNGDANIQFSPDGRKMLLNLTSERGENLSWLIPFPAGNNEPRIVLKKVPDAGAVHYFNFTWMPDSRHVALHHVLTPGAPTRISVADTESDALEPLTSGLSSEEFPVVSPDGTRLLFMNQMRDDDIVSVALDGSSVTGLIETTRNDSMPAWASNVRKLIYVTDRNGLPEIWIHGEDGSDHPLVTPKDFPNFKEVWFIAPTLSPDGNRAIYVAVPVGGNPRLWISSLNGGSPIPLTTSDPATSEYSGAWSPHGTKYVFLNVADGKRSLMIARTSGQASPVKVAEAARNYPPDWSPDGQWLLFRQNDRWMLISPDGKDARPIGVFGTQHLTFSRDSKTLYGIEPDPPDRQDLFSIDIATNKVIVIKDLGAKNEPFSFTAWSVHFSLSPDGKSIVYGVLSPRTQESLWMLEGFAKPSLLEMLHLR